MNRELLQPYTIVPNRCACHPETCSCNPWAVLHNGKRHTTYFLRAAAEQVAAALNENASPKQPEVDPLFEAAHYQEGRDLLPDGVQACPDCKGTGADGDVPCGMCSGRGTVGVGGTDGR